MFPRCLTRSFWVLYENLFKGLMTNMLIFMAMLGLISLLTVISPIFKANILVIIGLHIVLLALLSSTLLTGLSYYWVKVIKRDENIKNMFVEMWEGIRLYWLRGAAVFFINTLFFGAAGLVINFYRTMDSLGKLGQVLGGLGIWITIMFLIMQIYVMPILIMDKKKRIFTSYKKAAMMIMSAPLSSFFLLGFMGYMLLLMYPASALFFGKTTMPTMFVFISLMPIFFLPFLSYNFMLLIGINATMIIYEKHGAEPDMRETWEHKGLKNFFKPWENK